MNALEIARRLAGPAAAVIVLTAAVNGIVNGQGFTFVASESKLPFPDVIKQPDQISCGPTAVAMVLKYYGINAGIGPLKTAAHTRIIEAGDFHMGFTTPAGIKDALQSRGVEARIVENSGPRDLIAAIDEGKPPILLVRSGRGTWHYIVVTGYMNGGDPFRIHDPGGDVYWITSEDLERTWRFSGDLRSDGSQGSSQYIPDLRCDVCAGSGKVNAPNPNLQCPICSGSGKVKIVIDTPFGRINKGLGRCNACGGSGRLKGKIPKINCVACGGRGTIGDPQRKGVELVAKGNTMIVPKSPPAKTFTTRQLKVVNNTGGPLEVRLQYYENGRWHPTPPGPNSKYLTYKLAPGLSTYLSDSSRRNDRIEASVICIRGIAGNRQWNQHWLNKLPIVEKNYRAGKISTYTYTFR